MKVIVKTSGFYGGTWYEASRKHVDMPNAVAKPFMQPYGSDVEAAKPDEAAAAKPDKKAG